MHDFNGRVGDIKEDNIVGPFGLGQKNENGQSIVDCCRNITSWLPTLGFSLTKVTDAVAPPAPPHFLGPWLCFSKQGTLHSNLFGFSLSKMYMFVYTLKF